MKKIRLMFDMDGTIADLYGEENWLNDILAERVRPYKNAKPMNLDKIVNEIKRLKEKMGERLIVSVCTWTAKGGTDDYNGRVAQAKTEWLKENGMFELLESFMAFEYGVDKSVASYRNYINILFDDNNDVREKFSQKKNNIAFKETEILQTLKLIENM